MQSLKDGRVIFYDGEKVKDVTNHTILKICRDWMAIHYILQTDTRYRDLIT